MKMKRILNYFSAFEKGLWIFSVAAVTAAFLVFDRQSVFLFVTSLIGVTSLIFNAKANPVGAGLMIVFSALYAFSAFKCAYYGEVATYAGMTLPMSVAAFVSWFKNPFEGRHSQVKVNKITPKEAVFMLFAAFAVTVAFYFVLRYFNTANLLFSTLSVTTSFVAVYLTARRSRFFTFAYSLNDVVLVILWIFQAAAQRKYASFVVCFSVFYVNDMYGFLNWGRIGKMQAEHTQTGQCNKIDTKM